MLRATMASLVALVVWLGASASATEAAAPWRPDQPQGAALVERLRAGGLVLFFRHADTGGEPCDRIFRIGQRAGQRNLSAAGRAQAGRIGEVMAALGVPIATPVLAGPVYRARDTAELAFGAAGVRVVDGLLADDYAGGRLDWVLSEHRRLMSEPVEGANRVLVGHRGPAGMVFGRELDWAAFTEGSALVVEPGARPRVLGILAFAPALGALPERC